MVETFSEVELKRACIGPRHPSAHSAPSPPSAQGLPWVPMGPTTSNKPVPLVLCWVGEGVARFTA